MMGVLAEAEASEEEVSDIKHPEVEVPDDEECNEDCGASAAMQSLPKAKAKAKAKAKGKAKGPAKLLAQSKAKPKAKSKAAGRAQPKGKGKAKPKQEGPEMVSDEEPLVTAATGGQGHDTSSLDQLLRDRVKARKFHELFDSLPSHIQQCFKEAGKERGCKRDRQTEVINACFEKHGTQLILCENAAIFRDFQQRKDKKFKTDQAGGAMYGK